MFFSKPTNTTAIKKVVDQLPNVCFLHFPKLKDVAKNETYFKDTNSELPDALSLGFYLFYCVLVIQTVGIIKDKKILIEVQDHVYTCFTNSNNLSRVGIDKDSYSFFVKLYKSMYEKCNQSSSTEVMKFLSNVCVEFISDELGMNLSSKQISILAPLIAVISKDGIGSLVAESMNLNL